MYYQIDNYLDIDGYEIYFTRYADSILSDRFPNAKNELHSILNDFYIRKDAIIAGGGGKSTITQGLERTLYGLEWRKKIVIDEHFVDGQRIISESHEVDHYKGFENGNVGLEIEWNNKDPFYDRDLENFRKLHSINSIAIGIIITRGASLQDYFSTIYTEFLNSHFPFTISDLKNYLRISDGVAKTIRDGNILDQEQERQIRAISRIITSYKFGAATTHMDKLLLRIDRGLGNPCPLILIGIGRDRVI